MNNRSDIYPGESFDVIEATLLDGRPMVGSFNQAYKGYVYKSRFPWCLKISIGLDLENIKENGLPVSEETEIANGLEDQLLEEIQSITTAHYIGHIYNDSFLDIFIYLDDPEETHQFLQTQVNKEGLVRGLGYKIENDPHWSTVKGFL